MKIRIIKRLICIKGEEIRMKKVLFMPFLQIPSGHHQVADSLCEMIKHIDPTIECDKIDILHYSYGKLETMISNIYLKWIHTAPKTYHWLYQKSVYDQKEKDKDYWLYERLFISFMKKLIKEKEPDLIICSHALPSYMCDRLKQSKIINIPIINVYTDYFIHRFWGTKQVDYHFVAHPAMKDYLQNKGINHHQIFITGIPIHPILSSDATTRISKEEINICTIMGGSLGVGIIEELIPKLLNSKRLHFKIICGKNKKLFDKINRMNHPRIEALSYISNREEMNEIYNLSDIIITKPGGVTVSECLSKGIPALIYHALPGQEQINLKELSRLGLVFPFYEWRETENLEEGIFRFINTNEKIKQFPYTIKNFHSILDSTPLPLVLKKIINS